MLKKIARQVRFWQNAGHEVKVFCLTRPVTDVWPGLDDISIEYFETKNYIALFQKAMNAQKAIQEWEPDLIYWRYSSYYPGLIALINRFPTIVEINSNYDKEYKQIHNLFGYLFHRLTYRWVFSHAKGFVTLTEDLGDWVKKHNRPTLVCGDSFDLKAIESTPAPNNKNPNLVLLTSSDFPWIALDKVIRLAEIFPQWQFHIIGLNQKNTKIKKRLGNVHFYGFIDTAIYKKIIKNSDIAIGTLGLHRIGMNQMAPLKLREYLAYGLPTIIAYEDTDFEQDTPFILQLPNIEKNIEASIDKIEDFVYRNMGVRVNREGIQHIDTSEKEIRKLDFFQKIYEAEYAPQTASRILIIRSNPVAPDPRVEKTAYALADQGYSIDILGWDRSGNSLPVEVENGITFYRKSISAKYGQGIYNLPSYLFWQISELIWLIKNRNKYDVFHSCDFDTAIPAYMVTKVLSKNLLVYDLFDFYSDHIRFTPEWLKKLISLQEIRIIDKADGVIITDECRIEQIKGSNPKNLTIINNTPKDVQTYDVDILQTNQKQSDKGEIRIVYVGMLLKERGLFTLFDILHTRPKWILDLAGFGGDEEAIKTRIEILENICFHGRIDYQDSLKLGAKADLFYALYDPAIPNHKYASPNKIFEAMMLGKPVLVAKNTHIDSLVREYNCGLVVEYDNKREIEEAINYIAQNPELAAEMGKNARKAYDSQFSWKIMEKRLLNLYTRILEGSPK